MPRPNAKTPERAPRPATDESVAKEQGAAMNTGGLNNPDEK
jgi:hypothetical protein